MPRAGASSGPRAELTKKDDERLRKGMNKSGASAGKQTRKQPDQASGRRDAAPFQHGLMAPPPPEADFSNKRKSMQGQETGKKTAPKKRASAARQDEVKNEVRPAGAKKDTDVNVRVAGKPRSKPEQTAREPEAKKAGVKAGNVKVNRGQAPKELKGLTPKATEKKKVASTGKKTSGAKTPIKLR